MLSVAALESDEREAVTLQVNRIAPFECDFKLHLFCGIFLFPLSLTEELEMPDSVPGARSSGPGPQSFMPSHSHAFADAHPIRALTEFGSHPIALVTTPRSHPFPRSPTSPRSLECIASLSTIASL